MRDDGKDLASVDALSVGAYDYHFNKGDKEMSNLVKETKR